MYYQDPHYEGQTNQSPDFDLYFSETMRLGIEADYSLHLEYPVGGADHGLTKLSITPEEFKKQVQMDIDFFKKYSNI